jgi:NTE family protein
MESTSPKTAFVLTGGSIKGAFQAGAMSVLLRHYEPQIIYGVSIGALNGAFVANSRGKTPLKPFAEIGEDLVKFWEDNIRCFADVGKKRGFLSLVWSIITQKFAGLLDMSRYQNLVRKIISADNIQKSDVDFCAGIVDVISGKYFEAEKRGNILNPPHNFLDYIIASGITPFIYPTFYINERPLVDGGVRHVAPFTDLARYKDIDRIICVSCHPSQLRVENPDFKAGNVTQFAERIMEIVVNELVNQDIEKRKLINQLIDCGCEGQTNALQKIEMKIIRPAEELKINLQNFEAKDIRRLIDEGIKAAEQELAPGSGWF